MTTCSPTCSSTTELAVTQGESATFEITVRDENKVLIDLTGSKIWFGVKHKLLDVPYAILKRNTAAGGSDAEILILDQLVPATKGKARIFLVPDDTSSLAIDCALQYVCDLWIELSTGKQYQVLGVVPFKIKTRVVHIGGVPPAPPTPVEYRYSNVTRPSALGLEVGTMIYNTDDHAPNFSDGTNWRDAMGTLT